MHFFYIDESGDTGPDLLNTRQPIMVMGGLSVSDEKWNNTQIEFERIISSYFNHQIPSNFELHANELLYPNGKGFFKGHSLDNRTSLAIELLNILNTHSHNVHYISFIKEKISRIEFELEKDLYFNIKCPYELGFDYLITYLNWFITKKLGRTARGLIILDEKKDQHQNIENILTFRRFKNTKRHRIKRIVEFGYPIDSKRNPMVQLSDLIIYCIRNFLEIENGYKNNWSQEAKDFYAQCFSIINSRIVKKNLIDRNEGKKSIKRLNEFLKDVVAKPRRGWKGYYKL